MDVSVIVINFNTLELTKNCIASVMQFSAGFSLEIILVDNASTEADVSVLSSEMPFLKIIKNPVNVGFAKGNNVGISVASGEYILLLNSDTVLTENTISKLFSYLKAYPKVGAVSTRLIFPDGQHQDSAQRFPSIKYSLLELLRVQKFLPKRQSGKLLLGAFFNHGATVEADWVWGTCLMIPSKVINQLPGNKLDDQFFMYSEDVQWCMDIRKLGYKIIFFAESEVTHLMGGSSGNKNNMMLENGELFLKRNYASWEIWLIKKLAKLLDHEN